MTITKSVFKSLGSTDTGGCLSILQSDLSELVEINSTIFQSCLSSLGGAISSLDSSIIIRNSSFISNEAIDTSGEGGAIFHSSTSSLTPRTLTLISCNFTQNSATLSGGGIQWYSSQPILISTSFTNNSAYYGPDLASFTSSISLVQSRSLSSVTLPPGQASPIPLQFLLYDHYSQVVLTDNNTKISIAANDSNITIQGKIQNTANLGVAEFDDLKIYGNPGSLTSLSVLADGYGLNDRKINIPDLDIQVELRDCVVGEKKGSNYCERCGEGFYNLKPGDSCMSCVSGGVCYGGSDIYAVAGFWRRESKSDKIFKCFNANACLGDYNCSKCETGYEGNLCQVCSQGFSFDKENTCTKCLDQDENVGKIIGIVLVVIVFLAFQSYSTLESVYKARSITSIYLKILVNYLQLVALTIGFELDWPKLVRKMFNVQRSAASGSEQFISFDCFLSEYFNPFYAKVTIFTLIPFICFLFSLIFWSIKYYRKKTENLKEKFLGTIIVQFFFFYPTLIRMNFLAFYCTELDNNDYYLNSYMNVKCWSGSHLIFLLIVVIPSIILLCIGLPTILFVNIWKNRTKLDEITEKLKYGFLYNGFKSDFYYWEFVIVIRKLLIIVIFVFISKISIPIQALCTFLVILICFLLQLRLEPYSSAQLNLLEIMSITVTAVTIYSGIFFLTNDLSEQAKIIIFCLMALSNLGFLSFWLFLTFSFLFAKVYVKLKICKKLFRGRFDRWASRVAPIEQNNCIEIKTFKENTEISPYLKKNINAEIELELELDKEYKV